MPLPNQPGLIAAIVESSDDAIVSKDLNGFVTSWNRGAERLFGYTEAEMVGEHIRRIIPSDRLSEEDFVLGQVRLGLRVHHFETLRRRKDGTMVEISLSVSPVLDENGTIVGASKIARDISEQRRLRAALEEASRTKDEFLAMLGHELRNPLAPILTALQLMELRNEGGVRERALIDRQVRRVVALVDDLLDVSRITRGEISLRKVRVALAQVVADALDATGPLLEQRRHDVVVDVPKTATFEVDADAQRLVQVISNLLSNAAKYTDEGGRIRITAFSSDSHVFLRVRDNGIGISPRALDRIFEVFSREQRGDSGPQGLGLGLAIVKNLMGLHGGSVTARSEGFGLGSEFEISLPRSLTAAVEPPVLVPVPAAVAATGKRILVVDDNDDAASLLVDWLRITGHDARKANDPAAAIATALGFVPDVALLDIGLPGMDGYALARELRKLPGMNGLRLIALTGYGQESDKRRSDSEGFAGHLVKPIDVHAIAGLL